MNLRKIAAELESYDRLAYVFTANGKEGRICAHGPDLPTALTAAISAYTGCGPEDPYGDEPFDGPNDQCIQSVRGLIRQLKKGRVPFVLTWRVSTEQFARLDCSGDINVRQELISCLEGELQDVFPF